MRFCRQEYWSGLPFPPSGDRLHPEIKPASLRSPVWQDSLLLAPSLVAQRLKRLPAMRETWVQSLGREDSLEKEIATHSSTLAWRIPWGYRPHPLQYSCLETPMDRGAWWATVHGVTKNQTQLSDFHFHYSKVSKITSDGDCSHEIKRRSLLGRQVMTNLHSILKML